MKEPIPKQRQGTAVHAEAFLEMPTIADTVKVFEIIKNRILDVSSWQQFAGSAFAGFQLYDKGAMPIDTLANEGFFIRIDIPGPGSTSGDGYDWVIIAAVNYERNKDEELLAMTVHPSSDPRGHSKKIAHFFDHSSSSTFEVYRSGNSVKLGIYDRNLSPNKDAADVPGTLRDRLAGLGGMLFFSRLQWQRLVDGILQDLK